MMTRSSITRTSLSITFSLIGSIALASSAVAQVQVVTPASPLSGIEKATTYINACAADIMSVSAGASTGSTNTCTCPNGQAPAWVFPRGLAYDTGLVSVCLTNLGVYSPITGGKVSTNYNVDPTVPNKWVLYGKYLNTGLETEAPTVLRFAKATNDFKINPTGSSTATNPPRVSSLYGSEVHLYYYINDYRDRVLTTNFIISLGLSPTASTNLRLRQFRTGVGDQHLPYVFAKESTPFTLWNTNLNSQKMLSPSKRRAVVSDPLDSLAFDPEYVIGQYTGMIVNTIATGTGSWQDLLNNDATFGNVGTNSWKTDVRPAVLEGFKLWNAYRYSGNTDLYRYAQRVLRRWAGASCDSTSSSFNSPSCLKGRSIDNVMMYDDAADPVNNNPTRSGWSSLTSLSDDTLLFPFGTNYASGGLRGSATNPNDKGPRNAELAGMLIGAIFYDISKEVGLGDYKTDQLFWKTMSLISVDPSQALTMSGFAGKIQEAARALFQKTAGESYYEKDLIDVFTSRGIRINNTSNIAAGSFLNNKYADGTSVVPPALGTGGNQGPGTLLTTSSVGFGSTIPESFHNTASGYNDNRFFSNTYRVPNASYVTYQFYKYGKYGPCDSLGITNGTVSSVSAYVGGSWQSLNGALDYNDSMAVNYKGRDISNMLISAPKAANASQVDTSFLRNRQSCVSEREGYYSEDVRPFGFRALKAIPNGFTFKVANLGRLNNSVTRYQFTIVDPSVTMTGSNTGPATYAWSFTNYAGAIVTANGTAVTYDAFDNQPFTLFVERTRTATSVRDNLTFRMSQTDLARASGNQFNQDFVTVGYKVGFDTILDRRMIELGASYNASQKESGATDGIQAHRWKTPNSIVQPLTFSAVSHGNNPAGSPSFNFGFQSITHAQACIWDSRDPGVNTSATRNPECVDTGTDAARRARVERAIGQSTFQLSQIGMNLNNPFGKVTGVGVPGYLWTINYPSTWRLAANKEYHFAANIAANENVIGRSQNVCSFIQAPGTAGQSTDVSDWLAGPVFPTNGTTMRSYLSNGGLTNCTYAAYRFEGKTVPQ